MSTDLTLVNSAPTFVVRDGQVTTSIGSGQDIGRNVILQEDGKILVAGSTRVANGTDLALVRYDADGSLDVSFDTDGKITSVFGSCDSGYRIAVQSDGKILVAGTNSVDGLLARFNTDGSLDPNFDADGKVGTDYGLGQSISIQSDGKILVTGSTGADFALARYNIDGSLDASFDVDGKVRTDLGSTDYSYSVAVQADRKILVAGESNSNIALVRYNIDGSLDSSFDADGKVITSFGFTSTNSVKHSSGYSVAVQSDGKVLVAGTCDGNFALVRYNGDGSLDNTFGTNGKVDSNFGTVSYGGTGRSVTVQLQTDGKIVVAGSNNNKLAVVRYNTDGTLDSSFDSDGKVTNPSEDYGYSVAVQPDGKILVAGAANYFSDFTLARYNTDGSLDDTFSPLENTLDASATFIEPQYPWQGPSPVVLDANVQIFDADLSAANNYSGATLTLSRHNGPNAEDVFTSDGVTLSKILEDSYFAVGNVTIGRVVANSLGTLMMSFNANATQSLVSQAMQQIRYFNTSDRPPALVQIDWIFNDGNTGAQGPEGPLSVIGSTTVQITASNDPPVLSVALPDFAFQPNTAVSYVIPTATFSDPDGENLNFSVVMSNGTGLPPWLMFNASARTLSGTPGTTDTGSFTIRIRATDTSGSTASDDVIVTVAEVNDAPTGSVTIDGNAIQGQTLTAFNTLADVDGLGTIAYQWKADSSDIGGAKFGTLTLAEAQVGKAISVVANYTDGHGTVESVSSAATAAVVNVNDAPVVTGPLGNQSRPIGLPMSLNVGMLFSDIDAGDMLSFTATGLPSGLDINALTGMISGIATGPSGVTHVTVTATDTYASTASLNFDLEILSGNTITTSVVTRGGQALPGVFAHELHSITPAGSVFGFRNMSIETNIATGLNTVSADIVATGSSNDGALDLTLHAGAGASLQNFNLNGLISVSNGWSIVTNTNTANTWGLTASKSSAAIAADTLIGKLSLDLPSTTSGGSVLDLSGATLGHLSAPGRELTYTKIAMGSSGQLSTTLPDSNLTLYLERGTADYLGSNNTKPITAADALDALKLSVGLGGTDCRRHEP